MQYRQIEQIIDAIQLQHNNLKAVETFMAQETLPSLYPARPDFFINWGNSEIKIVTRDGILTAIPGDWIVRNYQGHTLYRFKPMDFAKNFEAMPNPNHSVLFGGIVEHYSPNCSIYPCRDCIACWCDCPCHLGQNHVSDRDDPTEALTQK